MPPQKDARALYQQARSMMHQGLPEFALDVVATLTKLHPRFLGGWLLLSELAVERQDYHTAAGAVSRCMHLAPSEAGFIARAAFIQTRGGRGDRALEYCHKLIEAVPNNPGPIIQHAETLVMLNRSEEALEAAQQAERMEVTPVTRIIHARALAGAGRRAEAITMLEEIHRTDDAPSDIRMGTAFHLAKLYDKSREYDRAWEAAQRAHELGARPFNAAEFEKHVQKTIDAFNPRNLALWLTARTPCPRAVLILGMPRGGTSLIEQILDMHSGAVAAGELAVSARMLVSLQNRLDSFHQYPECLIDLTPESLDELQQEYVDAIDLVGADAARVTNKSLANSQHLGLLSLILPGASTICVRRHPLDNLLSCHLSDMLSSGHRYCSSLDDLALVYVLRDRLNAHWAQVLDCPPLELSYEQLTHDQTTHTRRMLDHIGLPWEDDCLRFHESDRIATTLSHDQVNKPMYTASVGRWRHYEKHLGPLIDALGDELDNYESGL